jgi:hypothetical protein
MTGHFTSYETRTNHELATPSAQTLPGIGNRVVRLQPLPGGIE